MRRVYDLSAWEEFMYGFVVLGIEHTSPKVMLYQLPYDEK